MLRILTHYQYLIPGMKKTKEFVVVIEEDEDGGYVGSVPNLPGCHSQEDTLDELMGNMKEVIALCLESLAVSIRINHNEFHLGIVEVTV